MIKLENTEVVGWEAAIRGMRNPMNSWEKSDSRYSCLCMDDKRDCPVEPYIIGPNDLELMMKLRNAGTDHRKFMWMLLHLYIGGKNSIHTRLARLEILALRCIRSM